MNWVGGARNRLKLKHETKLQKEFFEKKRQFKSNTKTAISKRNGKVTAGGSQDLLSLEVIMAAHNGKKEQKKNERAHTSQTSGYASYKKSDQSCLQESSTKQLQHIFPELSPVRQHIAAANLEKSRHGNLNCSELDDQECIFSNVPLQRPAMSQDDSVNHCVTGKVIMDGKEKFCSWETTFACGTDELNIGSSEAEEHF